MEKIEWAVNAHEKETTKRQKRNKKADSKEQEQKGKQVW